MIENFVFICFFLCAQKKAIQHFLSARTALYTFALLATYHSSTFLYEKDLSAHKTKYMLETKFKQRLEKINCADIDQQVDCLMAKHEIETFFASTKLVSSIVSDCIRDRTWMLLLACLGFSLNPYITKKQ